MAIPRPLGPINLLLHQLVDVWDYLDAGAGSGDVVGPGSAVNDRIAVFDGATGKLIKDGGSTIAEIVAGSGGLVTSVFGRTGNIVAATNDYTFAQINKATSSLADLTTRSASDLSSGTLPDARFPSVLPAVSGANLTTLNASNLASGTVPDARFPATLPAASGANLTALNASNVASGTLADARLSSAVTKLGNAIGSDTQIIYNNAGVLGANSAFLFSSSLGSVGIGAAPSVHGVSGARSLTVQGASDRGLLALVNPSTGTTGAAASIMALNGSTRLSQIDTVADGATDSGRLSFYTNNAGSLTEKFRIDKAGAIRFLALTSNGFVKTSGGTGTLSIDTNTYLTGNQTITLSGVVTGSGATSITTSFASTTGTGAVVLAGSPTLTTPTLGVASATSLDLPAAGYVRWNGASDSGIVAVDAGPQQTGDAVKIVDGSALGWLWTGRFEVGNDPAYTPGSVPGGGGFYLENIRSALLVTGDPNVFDKWISASFYCNIADINANVAGTRDFYAVQAETGVNDTDNTHDIFTEYGVHAVAFLRGSGDVLDGMIGIMGKSHAFGSGTITKHRGVQGWATSQTGATGTSTLAQGIYGLISNDASGHTMTEAVAGDFILNSNAGTIGTGYVVRVRAETTGSGTITGNRYGLHIADQGVGTVSGTTYNFYSAGASRLNHIEGDLTWGGFAWQSWTPTLSGMSIGNGTVTAKFKKLGKTVVARLTVVFGSTSSVSGLIQFSLPATAQTYPGTLPAVLGIVRCQDTSGGISFEGVISLSGGLGSLVTYSVNGSQVSTVATSATVPFSWAVNDEFVCQIIYEAA